MGAGLSFSTGSHGLRFKWDEVALAVLLGSPSKPQELNMMAVLQRTGDLHATLELDGAFSIDQLVLCQHGSSTLFASLNLKPSTLNPKLVVMKESM